MSDGWVSADRCNCHGMARDRCPSDNPTTYEAWELRNDRGETIARVESLSSWYGTTANWRTGARRSKEECMEACILHLEAQGVPLK